jgi:hypothetical protein
VRAELDLVEEERGVPLELPLLDLEDLNAVMIADVPNFEAPVVAASQRYGADAVLLGRIETGGFGSARWVLVMNGTRHPIVLPSAREGLDAVADHLASRLVAETGAAAAVKLTVLEVTDGNDFGRVLSAVRGLSDVRAVDVVSASGETLVLEVVARGGAPQLERVLSLEGRLVPEARPTPIRPGVPPNDGLVFRLRR